MGIFKNLLTGRINIDNDKEENLLMPDEQTISREQDLVLLNDQNGIREQQLQKEATREVKDAAAVSLKKHHIIQKGRCPVCGEHLRQHWSASICEACGWHTFDTPRQGSVRLHFTNGEILDGEKCYTILNSHLLVIRNDVVTERVNLKSIDFIEYMWDKDEIQQRHKNRMERLHVSCGWCGEIANPEKEGFHLVHVAFGGSQERYCFCSDECYQVFVEMYPSRVHRDCYNRDCSACNLCIKRYEDRNNSIAILAEDLISIGRKS